MADLSWLNRLAQYIIIAATVAIVAFVLWFFRNIVCYLCISLVLSLMGAPLVDLLNRLRIGRWQIPNWLSATVVLLLLVAFLAAIFGGAVPLVISQFNDLQSIDLKRFSEAFNGPMQSINGFVHRYLPQSMATFDAEREIMKYGDRFLDAAFFTRLFSSTASWLVNFGILLFSVLFVTYFFLKDRTLFNRGLASFFPARFEVNIQEAMGSVERLLRRYFVGLLLQSSVVTVLATLGLLILRLPFNTSLVIGLMAGLFNVIPYVGGLLSLTLALVVPTLLYIGGGAPMPLPQLLLFILMEYWIVRLVDNFFLQPLIYSSSAKAHPLEIFIVLLMAAKLGGIVGMLIGVPVYIVLRVFAKEFFSNWNLVRQITKNI